MGLLGILVSVLTFVLGVIAATYNERRSSRILQTSLESATKERGELKRLLARVLMRLTLDGKEPADFEESYYEQKVKASLAAEEHGNAASVVEEWIAAAPSSGRARVAKAIVLRDSPVDSFRDKEVDPWEERKNHVEEAFLEAQRLTPDLFSAWNEYGLWRLHFRRQATKKTIESFERALQLATPEERDETLYYLGYCYLLHGRQESSREHDEKAVPVFESVLESRPAHYKARRCLAECLERIGQTDEAEAQHGAARIIDGSWRFSWAKSAGIAALSLGVVNFLVSTDAAKVRLGSDLQTVLFAVLIVSLLYSLLVLYWALPADDTGTIYPNPRTDLEFFWLPAPVKYYGLLSGFDGIMPRPHWREGRRAATIAESASGS